MTVVASTKSKSQTNTTAAETPASPASVAAQSTRSNKEESKSGDEEEGDATEHVSQDGSVGDDEEPPKPLYKSTRLKGYITLLLASAINYSSASQSDSAILNSAVPATQTQKNYAMSVSMVTIILSIFILLIHLDRFTCLQKYWLKAFKPKSKIELGLIVFLMLWWIAATWVQTSVGGICGTGKGQYNLYFSTWACCWTSIWTFERWVVASGMASFKHFLAEWPNRAPSWIATLIFSICTLLCYVDAYVNWQEEGVSPVLQEQYSQVGQSQWQWLLFVASITIPCALGFVVVEVFREQGPEGDENNKSQWENILEGCILLLLVLGWVPSVMVATTPGGIAALVGNAYFFTWATTVFVMETSVWWIHDWRKRIHMLLQQQQEDYERIQGELLEKNEAMLHGKEEEQSETQVESSDRDAASNKDESVGDAADDDGEEEEVTVYSERIPDSIGA